MPLQLSHKSAFPHHSTRLTTTLPITNLPSKRFRVTPFRFRVERHSEMHEHIAADYVDPLGYFVNGLPLVAHMVSFER